MSIRFFLACALSVSSVIYAESPIEDLSRFIQASQTKWQVPGVAVAVVKGDEIALLKGFGVTEIGKEEKVDGNTLFQLASVSKTFTAAAIGVQVDQKKATWDDPLFTYFPSFTLQDPYPSRYATVKDLLAHRTGLPPFGGDLLGKLGYPDAVILNKIREIEPAASFREKAFYSNVGYFAAGIALEILSKRSWEETVRETLLTPLEMKRSGFSQALHSTNVAQPHALIDGVLKPIDWDPSGGFAAAGGVVSSAKDMANFLQMLLNHGSFQGKPILSKETVETLFTPVIPCEISFSESAPIDNSTGFSYGLGFNIYYYQGHQVIEKGGALDGMRTVITLIPDLNLGIAVLCNLNLTLLPEVIRGKFLELYLGSNGKDIQKSIDEQAKTLSTLLTPPPKPHDAFPPPLPLNSYTASFTSPLYGKFKIIMEGDKLIVEAGPKPFKGTLTPWSYNTFYLKWPVINSGGELVTFVIGPQGLPEEMTTETLGLFKHVNQ